MFQGIGFPHLLILAVLVLVLFGSKFKISDVMGDVAKGIKSFKKGLSDEPEDNKSLNATAEEPVSKAKEKVKS